MKKSNLLLLSYWLLFVAYSLFSYVLTDPNLFILKYDWFVTWQTSLWQEILPLRLERTLLLGGLWLLLFSNYLAILWHWPQLLVQKSKNLYLYAALLALPLLLAYNALSYDVFNYMFNAKMVIEFGVDPHLRTAMEFADEPWLRFMNNVHTPAPYGYGWTGLSLLPYLLGGGKFLSTWLSFKLFAVLPLVGIAWLLRQLLGKGKLRQLALLLLNPLLLIEVLGNAHNDLWMLWPMLGAVTLLRLGKMRAWLKWSLAGLLMGVSITIKFASVSILPLLLGRESIIWQWLQRDPLTWVQKMLERYYFDLLSMLMFLPLLIERSKWFLPWYLLWALVLVPLVKLRWWRNLLLVFSFSAGLRYLPWLYFLPWMSYDMDTSAMAPWQLAAVWLLPAIYLVLHGVYYVWQKYLGSKTA
jgi:hypothetical protein